MTKIIQMRVKPREHELISMVECAGCKNKSFVLVTDAEYFRVDCSACGLVNGYIQYQDVPD